DLIRVCPEIVPRPTQRIEHEVQAGETRGAIAKTYGLTLEALLDQQDGAIADPNLVRTGQRLEIWIDGGVVPEFLPPEPSKSSKKKRSGGSRRRVAVALPPSDGVRIRRPSAAYGTRKTINLLQRAVSQYRRAHPGAPAVVIGDISRKGGGKFRPHLSHQTGRDIDLGYVWRGASGKRSDASIDVARTWALLEAFLATHQVVYVF